jgi:solute:Na+ symporter, SSS family
MWSATFCTVTSVSLKKNELKASQLVTLIIGAVAIVIGLFMRNVLDLMLYSYAFMVSGLFVPVIFALYSKKPNSNAALVSMISGGLVTLGLTLSNIELPFNLDPIAFGITISLASYLIFNALAVNDRKTISHD